MLRTYRRVTVVAPLFVAVTACNHAQPIRSATDLQIERMDRMRASFGTYFTHMADNAMLSDMCVSDIHFIPHTSEVSGIGEVRLNRLAKLLNTYGGTVRYATQLDDEALIEQRIGHVREYLALVGCSMDRVDVAVMRPGGYGMSGDEAVEKYKRGTAEDQGAAPSTTSFVPGMVGPSQGN